MKVAAHCDSHGMLRLSLSRLCRVWIQRLVHSLLTSVLGFAAAGHGAAGDSVSGGRLLSSWSFDEGSGNVLRDDSGHGHDGNIVGARYVRHDDGHALEFDGGDAVVDCGDPNGLSPQAGVTA
jgi:hypothetical protein